MANGVPPSGLGTARPAFVHNEETGATATPQIPTLQPMQFGAMPNWAASTPAASESALYAKGG
jgi:hypothetical protein